MTSNDRVVYYGIACRCGHPRIRSTGDGFECTECHAKLEVLNIPEEDSGSDRGLFDTVGEYIDRKSAEVSRIRTVMYGRVHEMMFTFRRIPPEINQHQAEKTAANAESIRRLEDENARLSEQLRRKDEEIASLNSTMLHLRSAERKAASVDIHGAMDAVAEYMCKVNSATSRKDTPEKMGMYLHNLTENLIMKLDGRGITLTSETPGSPVSGQVEVTDRIPTDDPSLDGMVESNEHFGCRFSEDAFPRILNGVRVYAYRDGDKGND